jgi:hypothetical protein
MNRLKASFNDNINYQEYIEDLDAILDSLNEVKCRLSFYKRLISNNSLFSCFGSLFFI